MNRAIISGCALRKAYLKVRVSHMTKHDLFDLLFYVVRSAKTWMDGPCGLRPVGCWLAGTLTKVGETSMAPKD